MRTPSLVLLALVATGCESTVMNYVRDVRPGPPGMLEVEHCHLIAHGSAANQLREDQCYVTYVPVTAAVQPTVFVAPPQVVSPQVVAPPGS